MCIHNMYIYVYINRKMKFIFLKKDSNYELKDEINYNIMRTLRKNGNIYIYIYVYNFI